MRQPRLKRTGQDTFYHLYNRVAGEPGYFPFKKPEKEKFIQVLRKLEAYYTVMNPVRAGMVKHLADYRFCSFGVWNATGRHPFANHLGSELFIREIMVKARGEAHMQKRRLSHLVDTPEPKEALCAYKQLRNIMP